MAWIMGGFCSPECSQQSILRGGRRKRVVKRPKIGGWGCLLIGNSDKLFPRGLKPEGLKEEGLETDIPG